MHDFSEDSLVLVTGASSGIGKASVLKLIEYGVKVVCVSRNKENLERLKKESNFPQNIFIEPFDLSGNMQELPLFIQTLVDKYGKFSGFVHSAGAFNTMPLRIFDYEAALKDFNLNYFSAIEITQILSKKKNRQELLSIVYVSSKAADCGAPGGFVYAASKASLVSSVKTLTKEIGKNRIRINSVLPGNIETDMTKKFAGEVTYDYLQVTRNNTPFSEVGKPEQVADLICFLLSSKSYWIQGQSIVINGAESL